ncbi:MAG: DUF1549 domain-containing protein [Verrucomicrobia bacterium]|nr:DUF1549 domain-containing protein [Verrucomicrobiota bacterium]
MSPLRRLPLLLPLLLCHTPLLAVGNPLPLTEALQIANRIDQLLEADLAAQNLPPNPLVPDDIFLRRAYLDIVGRIPTPREGMSFLDNTSPDKRHRLVEELVSSPGYESASFNYFADLLRLQTTKEQYGLGWHVWLRQSIAEDKPWNQMAYEMLAADGHAAKNPAVGYYLRDRGMLLDNVSNTMQVFLGHQIGCAQCHDHPFDRWSQMEYYELASFSSGVSYQSQEARNAIRKVSEQMRKDDPAPTRNISNKKNARDKKRQADRMKNDRARKFAQQFRLVFKAFNRNEISENTGATLNLPDDYKYEDGEPGEAIPPATLFSDRLHNVPPEDRREAFAKWLTSGNDYFAKVFANRLWDRTFGHGLVDPVDNWSKEAETAHPKVLAYLEEVMKRIDYRTRDFERILYHTRLFQRAASTGEATPGFTLAFQGPQLRRMRAEEIHDSLLVLTFGNVDDKINDGLANRWDEYRKGILSLLSSTPAQLIAANKTLAEGEQEKLEFQRKARDLGLKIREAAEKGDKDTANRLRQQLDTAKREHNRSRRDMAAYSRRDVGGGRPSLNMRASEYPTPFKGDHLVRQFGGSDRETPESSDTYASVPQALTLLNGRVAATSENRNSKVFEALAEITSAETRLEYLYLAFFGSRPTPDEIKDFLPLADDKDDLFTLSRAMLTSKRFLFVQ